MTLIRTAGRLPGEAGLGAQDPLTVVKQDHLVGKWKVVAVLPDCPPGEPNIRERSHSDG
jgi:hypothetical protein